MEHKPEIKLIASLVKRIPSSIDLFLHGQPMMCPAERGQAFSPLPVCLKPHTTCKIHLRQFGTTLAFLFAKMAAGAIHGWIAAWLI